MAPSILRLPDVKARTGLSRSSIYLAISRNDFPAPIRLGRRAVGWDSTSVDSWIIRKIEQSRKGAA
jgi:prophage regulatory protein